MPIYTMRKVRVTHDDTVVLDNVTLGVLTQAKIGVVGPNGSGKSTLLRVMAGLEHPSSGDAVVSPDIRVGILEQEPALDDAATVLGNVEQGVLGVRAQLQRYQALTQRLEHAAGDETPQLLDELGSLQEALDLAEAWDLDARIEQAMDALRCPPPDTPVRTLSGGERRRVALCKTLLSQPELLLLDEPTNHLDTESVAWLEQHLATYKGTVIAVTHDRYFLDHAAEWIVEIDRGHVHTYVGNYSAYLATRAERFKVEGRKDAKRRKRMADELAWIRAGERRHATSRARLTQYEELASHSSSNKVDFDEIQIPPAPRLGRLVLEADELTKAYGQRPLMEHLSFSLPRGGIVGVVGPNGVGKTTLFRMIVGEEQPDSGTLRLGDTVRISYVDQDRAALADNRTAWETISGGQSVIRLGAAEIPSRAYAATFGFKGADQQKPVALMSGGERNRLNLALTLKQGGNLLLLDEPTNDLDVESLASLENALLDFSGCAVVTAHDRWFLDRVATHILAWEGGTHWFWFEGNFAGYEANKAARLDTEPSRSPTVHRRLARE